MPFKVFENHGGGGYGTLGFCLEELWSLQLTSEEKERGQTRRQKMRRFRCCQPPAFKESQFSECLLGPYAFFKVLSGIFLQHVIFLHNLTWAGEVAQPLGVPTVLNQLAQTNSSWFEGKTGLVHISKYSATVLCP